MKDKKIEYRINNIRALAILIVVFGHSIILYSSSWNLYETLQTSFVFDQIKKVINLFQMPLFFSLSGYLFSYANMEQSFFAFIKKKCKRLIIPFFIVGIFWMIPIKMLLDYAGYQNSNFLQAVYKMVMNQENGHLWYLPTLFFLFILFGAFKKYITKDKKASYILVIVLLFVSKYSKTLPDLGFPYLNYVYQYAWSFGFGMIIPNLPRSRRKTGSSSASKILLFIVIMLTAVIDTIVLNRADILVTVIVIYSFYLAMPDRSVKVLNSISKNSFGMYLFHSPLIYITFTFFPNGAPYKVVAMNFILWGTLSYCITSVLRKIKLGIVIGE